MEFWARSPAEREQGFAQLRAEAPVSWHRQPESQLLPESEGTGGYWAIVRFEGDFVEAVAKRLPMMTITRMLGVPERDREAVLWSVDAAVSWNDPEFLAGQAPLEVVTKSMTIMNDIAFRLCAERRKRPADDLITDLVQAEVDGERLTDAEIGAFLVLLSVAGNDTTRHTTSHCMRALCDFPDQRALLLEELDGRIEAAVEEFVRWASPVMTFRRTATRDTEIAGQPIAGGEKVVMFYPSANRDEDVFDRPNELDITRS